jgi:hypothetical protein
MWVNSTDISKASNEKELITPVIYNIEEKYMTLILETEYKDGKPSKYKDEYDETLTYYIYNTESNQMEPYIFTSENKEEEFNNNKENFYIKYDEKLNSRNPIVVKLIRKEFKYDTVEYRLTKFK